MCRYHLVAALAGSEADVISTCFAEAVGLPRVKDVNSALQDIIVLEITIGTRAPLDHTPRADGQAATFVQRGLTLKPDGAAVLHVQMENT